MTRTPASRFGRTRCPACRVHRPTKLPRVLDATGYAAPTMATNGRFVAAIFATGELACLAMDGERIWAKQLEVPSNHYGHASSLICNDEWLFVQYDQKEKLEKYWHCTSRPANQPGRLTGSDGMVVTDTG